VTALMRCAHGGSVVTLDRGFAAAHPDVAVLLRPA